MKRFIGAKFGLVRFTIFSFTVLLAVTSPSYRGSSADSAHAPALVYKSTDAGLTWLPADTGMEQFPAHKAQVLAVDPNEPSILYAGTSYGVFKSTDAANSWEPVSKGLPQHSVTGLAIDSLLSSTLYALSANLDFNSGFVSQSNNGAVKWNTIGSSDFNFNTSIVIDPSNASTLYVGGDGVGQNADLCGVYKSINAGISWQFGRLGNYEDTIEQLLVSPEDPSVVYASVKGGDEGLYKSTDGGMIWNQIGFGSGSVALDPRNPSTIYFTDEYSFLKSIDAGKTWSNVSFNYHPTVISIDSDSPSAIYVAGFENASGNGLSAKSTDGGSNWQLLSLQAPVSCFAFDHSNPSTVYAGAQIPPPLITGVQINEKALVVTGQGFHAGAVIELGADTTLNTLKTTFDTGSQGTLLTAPKGSKSIAPGETVSIRVTEADRTQALAFQFTRPN
jgi:photosystem II stability/assembly factor-like uncharacterized protein